MQAAGYTPCELPAFEYVDYKGLYAGPENEGDHEVPFFLRVRIWVFWILLILPFRLFHIFYWVFMYALWYRLVIYPLQYHGGKIGYFLGSFFNYILKRVYVPFFIWWFQVQQGVYGPIVHVVPRDLFERVQREVRGGDDDDDDDMEDSEFDENYDPYVVVANHASYMDGFLIFRMFGEVGIIAKAALKGDGVVGLLLQELGSLFTDKKDIADEIRQRAKRWQDGDPELRRLLIFPEGTTENGKCILGFHRGPFLAGMPVKPVVFRFQFETFDPAMINGRSFLEYFEAFHSQYVQWAHVILFPPYVPTRAEMADIHLYAENCRRVMCEVHNAMLSGRYGFSDLILSNKMFVRHLRKKDEKKDS